MQYTVTKSIEINASLQTVWENVLFFEKSQKWSSWAILESDAEFSFPKKDWIVWAKYSWNGKILWSGNQIITEISDKKEIKSEIHFLKPFKSTAKNTFSFEEKDGKVLVTWTMIYPLPFFLFFLKKMITLMIGRDFERWLAMLKTFSENWVLETSTKLEWVVNYENFYYMGIKNSCFKSELWEKMKQDFGKLCEVMLENSVQFLWALDFSTSKTCINKGFFEYIACLKISKEDSEKVKNIPNIITWFEKWGKYLKVTHLGSYEFLANSWTLAMWAPRSLKLKIDSKRNPFEEYKNDPVKTETKDLITEIYVPIK